MAEADSEQAALDAYADSKWAHWSEITEAEAEERGEDYVSKLGNYAPQPG